MKIVFLDIDGVLNSRKYFNSIPRGVLYQEIDETKVELLKQIIDQTQAEIVLSSTWRGLKDMGEMNQPHPMYTYLTETLAKYGLSIMSHTPVIEEKRPLEIYTWLNNRVDTIEAFVILDDDWGQDDYRPYGLESHLIKTSFYGENGGLQPQDVEQAINILNEC